MNSNLVYLAVHRTFCTLAYWCIAHEAVAPQPYCQQATIFSMNYYRRCSLRIFHKWIRKLLTPSCSACLPFCMCAEVVRIDETLVTKIDESIPPFLWVAFALHHTKTRMRRCSQNEIFCCDVNLILSSDYMIRYEHRTVERVQETSRKPWKTNCDKENPFIHIRFIV